jgi:thiamine-phosphate pyrophosphorylase
MKTTLLDRSAPLTCLITGGRTSEATTPASPEFAAVLELARAAVEARVSLIQIREKNLTAGVLYELAARCARLTRGGRTRLVVNDRADVARAAGCDGVHLTARSLDASVARRAFGEDFLIGVSTHSRAEALAARDAGADFAILGPVFDTPSKRAYGAPLGLDVLREATRSLGRFPVIAVGGVTAGNARSLTGAGASGVAAIRMFEEAPDLRGLLHSLGLCIPPRID